MRLDRHPLAVAAILALAVAGCRKKDAGSEGTSVTTAAPVPTVTTKAATEMDAAELPPSTAQEAPAPPAPQAEPHGPPPSADHFWMPGHWQWGGKGYVWAAGHWGVRTAPREPPGVRMENPGLPPSRSHFWVSGHWYWTGTDWSWRSGHWEYTRGSHFWVPGHWSHGHGRWHWEEGRWQ